MSAQKSPNLDQVTSVNEDGSHFIIHPSDVSGRFMWARRVFALVLLVVYVALPWIKIDGTPIVFFDIANRKFHLLGITLSPQDLWVLFFAITGSGFALFLVTALLGRLWCGWACPYTVFLEHVFRRIERFIEGDATKRRRLDEAPWRFPKIWRRGLKHSLYLLVAAFLAHVFLSYFVSLERLYQYVHENPLKHLASFGTVAFLTASFYFCFAFFREQFCIMVCPYGRLQSAMTDDDTMIIGYDEDRGEPRGKATDPNAGDCINCRRCIQVCPTGIDIRNGLQLECIGCAACIDACDDIMRKVNRPTGLVRYDSMNGLSGKKRRILRPRIFLYGILGCLGLGALTIAAINKARPYDVNVSRMMGPPFMVDDASVRNSYKLRLGNKRKQTASFEIRLHEAPPGFSLFGDGQKIEIEGQEELSKPTIVSVSREQYQGPAEIILEIVGQPGDIVIREKVRFLGPNPASLKSPPDEQ